MAALAAQFLFALLPGILGLAAIRGLLGLRCIDRIGSELVCAFVGLLQSVRVAVASATESTKRWNGALLKQLTGGDRLRGAALCGKSYELQPTHTLWFQANHLPGVSDASHGFWRRMIVMPFKAKFQGSQIDTNVRERLLDERDGILTWLIQGARMYYARSRQDAESLRRGKGGVQAHG